MENKEEIQKLRQSTIDEWSYITDKTFGKLVNLVEATLNEIQNPSFQVSASGPHFDSSEKIMGLSSSSNMQQQSKTLLPLTSDVQKLLGSLFPNNLLYVVGTSNNQGNNDKSSTTIAHSSDNRESNLLHILYNELMDCVSTARGLDGMISLGSIRATVNNLVTSWGKFENTYLSERSSGRKARCIPCVSGRE